MNRLNGSTLIRPIRVARYRFVCLCLVVVTLVISGRSLSTAAATATPRPTSTPIPSATPRPSKTLTFTPIPTNTRVPLTGKISFISTRADPQNLNINEIYVMNPDGSNVTRLTDMKTFALSPVWSSDAKRILFAAVTKESLATPCCGTPYTYNLYIIDAEGKNQTKLPMKYTAFVTEIAWSVDGSRIAYTSWTGTKQDIYTVNADGSDQKRLTNLPDDNVSPAWSPDGKQIVFESCNKDKGALLESCSIYGIDADGRNATRLLTGGHYIASPVWSLDGKRIFYVADAHGDGRYETYVMDADGSNVTRLSELLSPDIQLGLGMGYKGIVWSPDRTHIVFSIHSSDGLALNIYMMKVDGTDLIRLTNNTAIDGASDWSSDSPIQPGMAQTMATTP